MKNLMAIIVLGTMVSFTQAVKAQNKEVIDADGNSKDYVVIDHEKENEMKTLFSGDIDNGGYLGFTLNSTITPDNNTLDIGGRLGWIWDHNFTLGLMGKGFIGFTEEAPFGASGDTNLVSSLGGGYGGLFIEPIIFPRSPVHLSFPISFGVGGIAYWENVVPKDNYIGYNYSGQYDYYTAADAFIVVEPGVELEINVAKFFRFGINASYRYASDVKLQNFKEDVINGMSYGITLKFGIF